MTAIMRRELQAYFSSPIGYIYLAVFYVFAGFYFFATTLMSNTADISGVFNSMFTIVLFLIPILTMRLFSEDLKYRTDQALLTAPINLTSLVLGKFFAASMVFLTGLAITLVYGLIVAVFVPPNWPLIWGNFVALLLLGMALIAIGMFISSLTESQVIAAVGAFAVGLALLLVDSLASVFTNPILVAFFDGISFMKRYEVFTQGIFDFSSIVFFLSVSAIFIFLTVRVQEKRRWS
ncbi:ABC transporter [Ruminococcaceae bacterium OttesenSCG-928-L11]|nr:ABC transporter [Ruminococcaceae bacterium OttesenSCG-928-L11]